MKFNVILLIFIHILCACQDEGVKNLPPITQNQKVTVHYQQTTEFIVTATDPENKTLNFKVLTPPTTGKLSHLGDNRFSYQSMQGQYEEVQVNMSVSDGVHTQKFTLLLSIADPRPLKLLASANPIDSKVFIDIRDLFNL